MKICDRCMEMECDCKICRYGNPCLDCEDYDPESDACKSNGACFGGKDGETE